VKRKEPRAKKKDPRILPSSSPAAINKEEDRKFAETKRHPKKKVGKRREVENGNTEKKIKGPRSLTGECVERKLLRASLHKNWEAGEECRCEGPREKNELTNRETRKRELRQVEREDGKEPTLRKKRNAV